MGGDKLARFALLLVTEEELNALKTIFGHYLLMAIIILLNWSYKVQNKR